MRFNKIIIVTIIAQDWPEEQAGLEGTVLLAEGTVMLGVGRGTGTEETGDLTRAMGLPESRNLS